MPVHPSRPKFPSTLGFPGVERIDVSAGLPADPSHGRLRRRCLGHSAAELLTEHLDAGEEARQAVRAHPTGRRTGTPDHPLRVASHFSSGAPDVSKTPTGSGAGSDES